MRQAVLMGDNGDTRAFIRQLYGQYLRFKKTQIQGRRVVECGLRLLLSLGGLAVAALILFPLIQGILVGTLVLTPLAFWMGCQGLGLVVLSSIGLVQSLYHLYQIRDAQNLVVAQEARRPAMRLLGASVSTLGVLLALATLVLDLAGLFVVPSLWLWLSLTGVWFAFGVYALFSTLKVFEPRFPEPLVLRGSDKEVSTSNLAPPVADKCRVTGEAAPSCPPKPTVRKGIGT